MMTHHTAVVALPPEEAWPQIQAIRRQWDRQFARWMPHVTLLYPFLLFAEFDEMAERLAPACAAVAPFSVTLAQFDSFNHGRGRFTIWLDPEPRAGFVNLVSQLHARIPECDDTLRRGGGFVPHLSVGQASGRAQLDARLAELAAAWQPIEWTISEIALIHRQGDAPFHVDRKLPLGG